MFESLDSYYTFDKTEKLGNVIKYYLTTETGKQYRIYVEIILNENNTHADIGFERYENDTWKLSGFTNDLTYKEISKLFGTIKKLILTSKPDKIYITTSNEPSKFQKYYNIISKMNLNSHGYELTRDNTHIYLSKGVTNKIIFSYKGKLCKKNGLKNTN